MLHITANVKLEDHWSYIAQLSAKDMLKSAVIEEKKFINIESECFGPKSMNDVLIKLHVLM